MELKREREREGEKFNERKICARLPRKDLCRHLIVQQSVIYYLLIWIWF